MTYIINVFAFSGSATLVLPNPNYGFVSTDGSGAASIQFQLDLLPDGNNVASGFISIDWFLTGASIGSGCTQRFDWIFVLN